MRIGQIVSIEDSNIPHIQTGVIIRKELEEQGMYWWYEVLCNDGCHHVLPAYLLSPRLRQIRTSDEANKSSIKLHNYQQHSTKHIQNKLHYIHNGKQKLKS